jgi:hypothetical protein
MELTVVIFFLFSFNEIWLIEREVKDKESQARDNLTIFFFEMSLFPSKTPKCSYFYQFFCSVPPSLQDLYCALAKAAIEVSMVPKPRAPPIIPVFFGSIFFLIMVTLGCSRFGLNQFLIKFIRSKNK